jgi:hypothetical protein
MASVRWLHLSDLHHGDRTIAEEAPALWEAFLQDLVEVRGRSGPWDVVFLTGDLTREGSSSNFASLSVTLEGLLSYLAGLGSNPHLVVVPGPHDALRLSSRPAAVWALLSYWRADAHELRDELWDEPANEYREAITRAFQPFLTWRDAERQVLNGARGWLPGDLLAQFETRGLRVEVACLNSAFLGAADDCLEGELGERQLKIAVPDTPGADLCFLVTHHAPERLHPQAVQRYERVLRTRTVQTIHLCAGLRSPTSRSDLPTVLGAPSLFGLPALCGRNGQPRILGYAAASIERAGAQAILSRWPRRLGYDGGRPRLDPDHTFHLDRNEAEVCCLTIERQPMPPRPPFRETPSR